MLLSQTIIDRDDVAAVCGLLHTVGESGNAGTDTREAAVYWASQVHAAMDRRDLETIAWLLRDISDQRALAGGDRDQARYWAAYLEGRMTR